MKAHKELEKDYAELKAQGPSMTEAAKHQFIVVYKASPELIEEVMKQFGDGYQSERTRDKAKMLAVDPDPSILDSSDEKSEAENDPLTAQ